MKKRGLGRRRRRRFFCQRIPLDWYRDLGACWHQQPTLPLGPAKERERQSERASEPWRDTHRASRGAREAEGGGRRPDGDGRGGARKGRASGPSLVCVCPRGSIFFVCVVPLYENGGKFHARMALARPE